MILYTPVCSLGSCEKRYYIRYGQMISRLLLLGNAGFSLIFDYPEEYSLSPFNPFIGNELASWDFSNAQDRADFLKFLSAISPMKLVDLYSEDGVLYSPVHWPLPIYPSTNDELEENYEIFVEFLTNYFLPQYWDDFLSVYSLEEGHEALDDAYNEWFTKFLSLMAQTQRKYFSLIKYLKEKEGKLLDQVQASGYVKTRFNDTPQNTGDYEDPLHNTNFTRSDNSQGTDMETPMKRLKEIRDNIEDYYTAWAFDFDKLFMKEETLE